MARLTISDFDLFNLIKNAYGNNGRIIRVNSRPGEGAMLFIRNMARVFSKHSCQTTALYDPETTDGEHLVLAVGNEQVNGDVLGVDYMVRRFPNTNRDDPNRGMRLNVESNTDWMTPQASQYRSELLVDLMDAVKYLHEQENINVFFMCVDVQRIAGLMDYVTENNLTIVSLFGMMMDEAAERDLWVAIPRAIHTFDIQLRTAYKDAGESKFFQSITWYDIARNESVKRYNVYQLSKLGTFVLLERPEVEVTFSFL